MNTTEIKIGQTMFGVFKQSLFKKIHSLTGDVTKRGKA